MAMTRSASRRGSSSSSSQSGKESNKSSERRRPEDESNHDDASSIPYRGAAPKVCKPIMNPYKTENTTTPLRRTLDKLKCINLVSVKRAITNNSNRFIKSVIGTMLLISVCVLIWKKLNNLEMGLYEGRVDTFFVMGSRSPLTMWSLMISPFTEYYSRAVLYDRVWSGQWGGHSSNRVWYDPDIHNNEYRQVQTNVMTEEECSTFRDLVTKNLFAKNENNVDWVEGLRLELDEISIFTLVEQPSDDTTEQEKQLLYNVLTRIQNHMEKAFHDPDMYIEYGGPTRRSNKVETRWTWSSFKKRWWYITSSGHGFHADQCNILQTSGEEEEDWIEEESSGDESNGEEPEGWVGSWYEWLLPKEHSSWNHDFECEFDPMHCCFDRTHSALLYLNDPGDQSVVGGELFMLDRKDLGENIAVPSYSGASLAKQSEHVLMLKPTCGTLAMFTSDARNIHGTYPTASGQRFALPMWFTSIKNLPRTSEQYAFTREELEHIEDGALGVCERPKNTYPPPSGLIDESIDGDCDDWMNRLSTML
eukprot:scaffold53258_cov53-Attheya_sp.AAC.1